METFITESGTTYNVKIRPMSRADHKAYKEFRDKQFKDLREAESMRGYEWNLFVADQRYDHLKYLVDKVDGYDDLDDVPTHAVRFLIGKLLGSFFGSTTPSTSDTPSAPTSDTTENSESGSSTSPLTPL